ncbi:hypothetical protein GCM10011323_03150 [Pontibacter amylolyticus]|uniref:Uncharacterized protein n=1 Tax=Pontibacter amylolyticus TaxID=1424080 RepID=A0ABQ1VVK9_9BACT|nr:hypothetical protein GCM10011323_03150 [Pontibacter amylolyticus]
MRNPFSAATAKHERHFLGIAKSGPAEQQDDEEQVWKGVSVYLYA